MVLLGDGEAEDDADGEKLVVALVLGERLGLTLEVAVPVGLQPVSRHSPNAIAVTFDIRFIFPQSLFHAIAEPRAVGHFRYDL